MLHNEITSETIKEKDKKRKVNYTVSQLVFAYYYRTLKVCVYARVKGEKIYIFIVVSK